MQIMKRLGFLAVLIAALVFGSTLSFACGDDPIVRDVAGAGGVNLKVFEYGKADGQPIVLLHGWSQSHKSWVNQYTDKHLTKKFRLIVPDLRGHGESGRADLGGYMDGTLWAADLKAIMDSLNLEKPVLVGWSYGGAVILDYLTVYGDGNVGGINFVDALGQYLGCLNPADTTVMPAYYQYAPPMLPGMGWPDDSQVEAQRAACRGFIVACLAPGATDPESPNYNSAITPEAIETAVDYNMQADPFVRLGIVLRPGTPVTGPWNGSMDYTATLQAITVPTLVTTGDSDMILNPETSAWMHSLIQGSELSVYVGIGHSPFMEDASRFNKELRKFAK